MNYQEYGKNKTFSPGIDEGGDDYEPMKEISEKKSIIANPYDIPKKY